jgi:hypothetical protein
MKSEENSTHGIPAIVFNKISDISNDFGRVDDEYHDVAQTDLIGLSWLDSTRVGFGRDQLHLMNLVNPSELSRQ